MRLFRLHDQGEAVRDIQDRLTALGYDCSGDPPTAFGTQTDHAVRKFQHARGLACDGIVGSDTWRELVEAGFKLGDRLLYYRRPMVRGDDVGALQAQLNRLGFDAGKVDGIFGPDTQQALLEFQQNRGLAEDGIAGPVITHELALVGRTIADAGRQDVRERQWLRERPAGVAGLRIYLDPACRDEAEAAAAWGSATAAARVLQARGAVPLLSRAADVYPTERVRARRANVVGADLVIGLCLPQPEEPRVYYFETARSRSEVGARLATVVAARLGLEPAPRATPMLRETRSPAVVVATGVLDSDLGSAIAEAISRFLAEEDQPASKS